MTLVSELVLTRNQLVQLAPSQGGNPFDAAMQRLSHLTSDLQEGVMKTRMQPIGSLHSTLLRLVRGLGQDLNKPIEFVMTGANTEMDRQVLEMMRDPLIHMVRNSADHGLEPASLRQAAGKPASGLITLNAYHEGGYVVIELSDDGAGLQTAGIGRLALARGLVTEAELATMTERQIHHFIFSPGFSTASQVSAVSGRGVGMEVVKANIERIGGAITLHSTAGRGTMFTIRIPLTLAIISAFILEAGGERFALPQACVAELVRTGAADHPPSGPANRDAGACGRRADAAAARAVAAADPPWRNPTTGRRRAEHAGLGHRRAVGQRPHSGPDGGPGIRHGGDRRQAGSAAAAPHHHVRRQRPSSAMAPWC